MWTTGSVCSRLFAQIYYSLSLLWVHARVSLQVCTLRYMYCVCFLHFGCVFFQKDLVTPVHIYSDCTQRDWHVNMFKIAQPVGASKYLSNLLCLHPFTQLRCKSISGCRCSAISGSALDHDICLTFLIPLSQRHRKVPHTSSHRCLNTFAAFPSFLLEMWSVSWRQTPEHRRRGGQISLAGLTATVRTCVTPRKYLLLEHAGVTASTNIISDHKSDFSMFLNLTACRFSVRMNRCTSNLPGVITISAGLAGGCDMGCEIVLCSV